MTQWPQSLALVGAGKMGGAMLKGWLEGGLAPSADRDRRSLAVAGNRRACGRARDRAQSARSPVDGAARRSFWRSSRRCSTPPRPNSRKLAGAQTLVVSIIAGKTIANLAARMPKARAFVRVDAQHAGGGRPRRHRRRRQRGGHARRNWRSTQTLMSAVGGSNGSPDESADRRGDGAFPAPGPAYVFALVEAMAEAGASARASRRSRDAARPRDGRGRRRVDASRAGASAAHVARKRDVAGRHDRGGAGGAARARRARGADAPRRRRRPQARGRTGGLTFLHAASRKPPSQIRTWPVTKLSAITKAIALAMSSGAPTRPTGVRPAIVGEGGAALSRRPEIPPRRVDDARRNGVDAQRPQLRGQDRRRRRRARHWRRRARPFPAPPSAPNGGDESDRAVLADRRQSRLRAGEMRPDFFLKAAPHLAEIERGERARSRARCPRRARDDRTARARRRIRAPARRRPRRAPRPRHCPARLARRGEPVLVAAGDRDLHAFAGEPPGAREADA